MLNILSWLKGDDLKRHKAIVEEVNGHENALKSLSDLELQSKTTYFKDKLASGSTLEEILPEAFAVVREASRRTLGQRHYDVQVIGGSIIHYGNIAEMRTGEGKTLVATLPVYLNALTGKGVHVITVNDYLARRDAVWMGQIYSALGLSLGVVNSESSYLYDPSHKEEDKIRDEVASYKIVYDFLRPCSRKDAYNADITYGTNSEFGFDYLRDNIEYDPARLRQRGHAYAIVDEIDSILIDEARTPLIISAPQGQAENLYPVFANVARQMNEGEDFTVNEKFRSIAMTDQGIEKAEKILGIENIYTEKGVKYVHHLENAVRAKALFKKDKAYVVKEGEVIIVDEFTGRMQPGRRWSEGLHQAVEAKEGITPREESRTYASITYQNYFRLYKKLSGMTGTALTSKEEFEKVYGLDTVVVPTHRDISRIDKEDLIFQTEHGKFVALGKKVKELQAKGQPVLIGTVSIEKNELLSDYLKRAGVQFEMLNAKNHEREAEIVANAGKIGAVTVATNMAGRGVDIKLGGIGANKDEYDEVKNLGGLYVIGTERHEARRIDNQLRGRSGRQGDPGETRFYVSLEDDLMRVFASDMVKSMMGKLGIPEDEPIENGLVSRSIESAQKKIEGFHFDSRKHVLEFDNVLNFQRVFMYERRMKILLGDTEQLNKEWQAIGKEDSVPEEIRGAFRRLLLQVIDTFWIEHLELMDYLRQSVNLRAYGQHDPLTEYKREGLRLYKEMEQGIQDQIAELVPKLSVDAFKAEEDRMKQEVAKVDSQTSFSKESKNEVGRNDPCPCGSGKKYKKCHGK